MLANAGERDKAKSWLATYVSGRRQRARAGRTRAALLDGKARADGVEIDQGLRWSIVEQLNRFDAPGSEVTDRRRESGRARQAARADQLAAIAAERGRDRMRSRRPSGWRRSRRCRPPRCRTRSCASRDGRAVIRPGQSPSRKRARSSARRPWRRFGRQRRPRVHAQLRQQHGLPAPAARPAWRRLQQAAKASEGLSEGARRDPLSKLVEDDARCIATRAKFEQSPVMRIPRSRPLRTAVPARGLSGARHTSDVLTSAACADLAWRIRLAAEAGAWPATGCSHREREREGGLRPRCTSIRGIARVAHGACLDDAVSRTWTRRCGWCLAMLPQVGESRRRCTWHEAERGSSSRCKTWTPRSPKWDPDVAANATYGEPRGAAAASQRRTRSAVADFRRRRSSAGCQRGPGLGRALPVAGGAESASSSRRARTATRRSSSIPSDWNSYNSRGLVGIPHGPVRRGHRFPLITGATNTIPRSPCHRGSARGLAKRASGDAAGGDQDVAKGASMDPTVATRYRDYGLSID